VELCPNPCVFWYIDSNEGRKSLEEKEQALYIFRKLVYVLYLEIGSLQPRIHPELAEKADMRTQFFRSDKARMAAELYYQVEDKDTPADITGPFEQRTHLTLEDIHRAFVEGDWRNKFGGYNYGGPRWVEVADATLRLRDLIEREEWDKTAGLLFEIKGMKTNQGYLIHQFERTERRR
jgi:hypothetical protein